MYVAVVGPGNGARPEDVASATAVGRLLASRGATLLTGGLGGVMAAAHAGAAEAGGLSVAVLPGTDRAAAPPGTTVALPTGLGELRNALLIRSADAVIAIGGSWGTLSEIAFARRTGVPVVCLGGWVVTDAAGQPLEVRTAQSADEAVDLVLNP